MEQNIVGWFEIPVTNMERAKDFYEKVFSIEIKIQDFGGLLMGWFPFAEGKEGISGSLVMNDAYKPSESKGVLIYFSSTDVNIEVGKIEDAGGKILQAKTQISPDIGYMAVCLDTEGNRFALHSRS